MAISSQILLTIATLTGCRLSRLSVLAARVFLVPGRFVVFAIVNSP
jgi:hypothetical protein